MRLRHFPVCLLALGLCLCPLTPVAAQTTAQVRLLDKALSASAEGEWTAAAALAGQARSPVATDIVLWTRLRDGAGTWSEYEHFLSRNANWPGLATLRRAGERLIPRGLPPSEVIAYFGGRPPETGIGALRLAAALADQGDGKAAEAEIARAWRELSLSPSEQKLFRAEWSGTIRPEHLARLDNLLWQGWTREAEAMLPLVDEDWQKLAQARIATRRDAEGLQYAISQVPAQLKGDPGLAYERYLYRISKRRWQDAEDFILESSRSADALGRPDMWMDRRANLARQALEDGQPVAAYRIASRGFGTTGADYADAEWVAGFVALTRMNDPDRAITHFRRFRSLVGTPISLGRAGYWLGVAYERHGNPAAARLAWRAGAQFQTSFYGQLAAEQLAAPPDPRLAGGGPALDWRTAPFRQSRVVQAAYLLHLADDEARASQFFRHAAEDLPPDARAALAQMAIDIGRPEIGIRIAKDSAGRGVVLPDQYYPLHAIARGQWPVPTEFAMAIARQESELDASAASSAGARGLMQLMPATAETMAEMAGVTYDPGRLTRDPMYNARLGTEYLARMLARYDGSYVLATAAYNAGPGRVDQWIRTEGDPRDPEVDAVVWIELIPFNETRNYVMRVLEALHVYRARLQGRAAPVQLVADINRTG
jgi:peptidoglycan lytic transglycosylase